MKGSILVILGFIGTLQAAPWTDREGPLLTTGIGLSPIYVEEVTRQDNLVAGATVTPAHVNVRYGTHLLPTLVLAATAEFNSYTDSDGNLYIASLLGVSTELLPDEFFNTRLRVGVGYADKRIFGTGLSAGGWGFSLGFIQPFTASLGFEANYAFRSFNSVASTFASGEAEHSSALTLGLSYRWL